MRNSTVSPESSGVDQQCHEEHLEWVAICGLPPNKLMQLAGASVQMNVG